MTRDVYLTPSRMKVFASLTREKGEQAHIYSRACI